MVERFVMELIPGAELIGDYWGHFLLIFTSSAATSLFLLSSFFDVDLFFRLLQQSADFVRIMLVSDSS